MRYSDINVQHVYYVNFNDVMECEFDSNHLAVVLKKNKDKKTFIVAPLTTKDNGKNENKYNIGILKCLPKNLQKNESYIVYNQVRTVNIKRFSPLKDSDGDLMQSKISDKLFSKVTLIKSSIVIVSNPISHLIIAFCYRIKQF